jgi:ubiquinone/menaquinone biosynthesis C-methylase UbiE
MIFQRIADNSNPSSLATRFRKTRFSFFLSLINRLEHPISILDVGGTEDFWNIMGINNISDVNISLLNISECKISNSNINFVKGNACDIKFPDSSFDIVFSNSVIEHVGNGYNQKQMANEVKRVGKRYFVQTPSKSFFLEPHFLFPFFFQ